jgi:hypothetical protein
VVAMNLCVLGVSPHGQLHNESSVSLIFRCMYRMRCFQFAPWSNEINPHDASSSQSTHQSPDAVLTGAITRGAVRVQKAHDACFEDQASVKGARGLSMEIVRGQLRGVEDGEEVDLENSERRFHGLFLIQSFEFFLNGRQS